MLKEHVLVAQILGPHGVKGQLKMRSFTSDPFNIKKYSPLLMENGDPFLFKVVRHLDKDVFLISIPDVTDRDRSLEFKNVNLYISKNQLPEPDEDEYYFVDLIGCSVLEDGKEVGYVLEVNDCGAGIFLDIKLPDTKKIATLPFSKDSILSVDIEHKIIVANTGFILL